MTITLGDNQQVESTKVFTKWVGVEKPQPDGSVITVQEARGRFTIESKQQDVNNLQTQLDEAKADLAEAQAL